MRVRLATGTVAAVCAAAVALPAAALAAPPTPAPSPSTSASATAPGGAQSPGGPASSAVARAALVQTPSGPPSRGALSRQERLFLAEAAHDAQFEIAAGHLATSRAASAAVRSFGQRMVTDHSKQAQQLQSLDRSLGITPPTGVGADEQNMLRIWSSLRGGSFDCSYTPTMYAAHALDVHTFAYVAKHASNAQVRRFAAGQVPVLAQHLQLARKNLNNLNCSAPPPSAAPS